ncbi:MAG: metallophosphoesterase family protein [Candidatus Eisenbacteria bacterium]|nr:metallophosphoesterase family protein [Candidatus Eisenbacteria bacterium]
MILAILSDIHGNLEALETALRCIDEENADEVLCLGDIVGYGANPNECVERVRARCAHVLLGNHDAAAIGTTSIETFNTHARRSALWTGETLAPANGEYLRTLPMDYRTVDFYAVHASPNEREEWHYIVNQSIAEEAFLAFPDEICFIGHSHLPMFFREGGARGVRIPEGSVPFPRDGRYIINVGSVGQPRDNDPRLSFGIYDTSERKLKLRREVYDVAAASAKILKAGLPEMLATRLRLGV